MGVWRMSARLAAVALFGGLSVGAMAQTPMNPPVPPPNFRTVVTARLFCGTPDCPEQTYDTRWVTNELGDVYAADSGLLYPLNKEVDIHQFPIALRQWAVPGTNVTGVVGSSFRADVFTAYYQMDASSLKANFKMRVRFHPFSKVCEILTWEYWGRSGGASVAKAFVRGKCMVEPPRPPV
jgi:hypothetical protein